MKFSLLAKPIFLIRECYCIDIFSHFPLHWVAGFWSLFSRVCMSVFCDNSCGCAETYCCSYQFIGFLRRRSFRSVNDWRHSCQLCYLSCSVAWRSEFATKSSQNSCRTETHIAAWYSQPDSTGQTCTVRSGERTLSLVSWYSTCCGL